MLYAIIRCWRTPILTLTLTFTLTLVLVQPGLITSGKLSSHGNDNCILIPRNIDMTTRSPDDQALAVSAIQPHTLTAMYPA